MRVSPLRTTLCLTGLIAMVSGWVSLCGASSPSKLPPAFPTVSLQRLPGNAIQPQCAVDAKGTVHLVYFKGAPEAGDLYYCRFAAGTGLSGAAQPIRVNSEPGTAMAVGTIRSEQIAIGRDGRIHVIWNGLAPKNGRPYAPMYAAYARLNDAGTAFEAQRNLCQLTGNLDGGDSVAADGSGNVYAVWHTGPPNFKGEAERGVWVAVSHDDGKSFGREKLANPEPTGACACCSMRAMVDGSGKLQILYRCARKGGTERDTMLLTSGDQAKSFKMQSLDPWPLNSCPMSSFSMASVSNELLAAWETNFKVFWSPIGGSGRPSGSIVAPGAEKSKHPLLLANGKGDILFAWTEGTGWQKGGSLSWQVYKLPAPQGSAPEAVGPIGHADGVPAWSLLSGYARPDGSFVILY